MLAQPNFGRLGAVGYRSMAAAVRALFAGGEQGAWYDPTDFNANWRRNLLTYSEQFDNAAWTKSNASISANAIVAPDGTLSGDTLVDNSAGGTGTVAITRNVTLTTPVTHTFSFYAKANGLNWVSLQITAFTSAPVFGACYFDLANGVLGGTNQIAGTITAVGDGWYRCTGIVTPDVGDLSGNFAVYVADSNGDITVDRDGTSSIYIWGAQLEVGSTATTYQRITDGVADYADSNTPVLYQDSAGTTLCSAVEQPVGLMLDKRKGLVLGSELVTFASLTGTAEWSYASNVWTLTSSTSNSQTLSFAGLTSGNWYRMTVTVTAINAGSLSFRHPNSSTVITNSPTISAAGTYTIYFAASSTAVWLRNSAVGQTITVSAFSVREIAGNHAYQSTSAARPTLRARYNLLTYSEQFDNAAWAKSNSTITQNAVAAPDGATTADKLIPNAAATDGRVSQTITGQIGVAYTYSVYAKQGELTNCRLYADDGATNIISVAYNLSTGAVATALTVSGGNWTSASSSISSVGNGWWRIIVSWTAAVAAPTRVQVWCRDTGDGTSGIYIWGADLRPTNLATGLIPAYQRIAAATDYDTVGFPVYIQGNGSSQFMLTASIDFSATDKMTVWSAVRKLSDAAQGTVMELGTDSTSTSNGAFALFAPASAAANYGIQLRGTAYTQYRATTFTAPISNVLSTNYDIAGALIANEVFPRVNAATPSLADVGGASAGTGNFGNHALYLLARAGSSLWFGGYFYGAIIRGAASDEGQIQAGEKYLNNRARVY